jgi:hypothetical protein
MAGAAGHVHAMHRQIAAMALRMVGQAFRIGLRATITGSSGLCAWADIYLKLRSFS